MDIPLSLKGLGNMVYPCSIELDGFRPTPNYNAHVSDGFKIRSFPDIPVAGQDDPVPKVRIHGSVRKLAIYHKRCTQDIYDGSCSPFNIQFGHTVQNLAEIEQ